MNFHLIKDIAFDVVISCSVLHTFLPPYDADAISQFPTFQKYYRLLIYLVGYIGINARSLVWKQISTDSGTRVSDVASNSRAVEDSKDLVNQNNKGESW